jgi:hypothetical protein
MSAVKSFAVAVLTLTAGSTGCATDPDAQEDEPVATQEQDATAVAKCVETVVMNFPDGTQFDAADWKICIVNDPYTGEHRGQLVVQSVPARPNEHPSIPGRFSVELDFNGIVLYRTAERLNPTVPFNIEGAWIFVGHGNYCAKALDHGFFRGAIQYKPILSVCWAL